MEDLTRMYAREICDSIVQGITYALTFKSDEMKNKEYLDIKQKLKESGFNSSEVMRVFELCNGYIFDLDLSMAQRIAIDLIKSTLTADEKLSNSDKYMLRDKPRERHELDMQKLADECVKKASESNKDVVEHEVALFSKNKGNVIKFNAQVNVRGKLKPYLFTYSAYALKHTDLEELNRCLLVPRGLKICKVQPCEILPTKTGVKFKLWIEKLDPKMKIIN